MNEQHFGSIVYSHLTPGWIIRTQPHVAVRLKRIFPKIDASEVGILHLSDIPENARELEWFLAALSTLRG